MEIQDRNNMMQLALNFNFDNKSLSASEELGFIDMIKNIAAPQKRSSTDTSIANNTSFDKQLPQSSSKASLKKSAFSDTSKKDTAVESKKKAHVETDNKTPKSQPTSTEKNKGVSETENVASYAVVQSNNETTEDIDTTVNSDVAPTEDVVADFSDPIKNTVEIMDVILPAPVFELAAAEITPEAVLQTEDTADVITFTEETTTPAPVQTDIAIKEQPVINIEAADTKETKKSSEEAALPASGDSFELPSEDQLLLEQTRFLERKLSPSHQVKIEVEVNEEKIAAPIKSNIIRNSFEVTSLLQHADFSENAPISENLPTEENFTASDIKGTTELPQTFFNGNEVYIADTAKSTTTIEDVAVNSIRGIDLSSQPLNRTNLSAKTQELNDNSLRGMSKEVIDQIKVNITKSAVKGVDTIDIQLKPQDLGKVQIRMYVSKDGHLHTDIISSRQETADLLQREVETLSRSFQEAGYDTDKQSFNFSFQKENQANQQEEQQLKQFIGNALEQEETAQANDNQVYDPALGLNIRV